MSFIEVQSSDLKMLFPFNNSLLKSLHTSLLAFKNLSHYNNDVDLGYN